jgi:hypothetical protein
MKNYIGISMDHSRSMYNISRAAARDYNANIQAFKQAAITQEIDTIVSVVKCGVGYQARVDRETLNSNVQVLKPINETAYITDGAGTPLWDSVGDLIETMSAVPDAANPEVSFLVMVITDGHENCSQKWRAETLSRKIQELQASDRWTFVFRVPRGYKRSLVQYGIPEGNILEWDQTERGVAAASEATSAAIESYYTQRKTGQTSTNKFYADLSKVSVKEVKQALVDISQNVKKYTVAHTDDGVAIKAFVEKLGHPYKTGSTFYQLSKTETVQEYKQICIRDRTSGAIYSGVNARDLLGLPHTGSIKLAPHNLGNYDVFVQSTSVNRKLIGNTTVLYFN